MAADAQPQGKEPVVPDTALEIVDSKIKSNRIKKVLKDKGVTQEELSRRVGVSYRHINRLTLGRSEPSLLLAHRISTVLDEPVEELFDIKISTRRVARTAA
jgi:DNA-binding XRE family transcriptional regulator